MAWRPSEWILDGELDNTTPGWTIGSIRLQGREDPLRLKLAGNCHPDLVGWRFKIVRTDPIPDWVKPPNIPAYIHSDQSGHVGDMTADQMLKHYECSTTEFVQRECAGERVPTTWRKSLYLEWFSNKNGRVVIQSTRLSVERQGERAFELTEAEWAEQVKQNAEELNHFMHQLAEALEEQEDSDQTE